MGGLAGCGVWLVGRATGYHAHMKLLDVLADCGALRPGHTHFRNGLFGDGWIEKGHVMRDPALLAQVAAAQAQSIRSAFPEATLLIGAPACGAVLASFVAQQLGLGVAYVLTDSPAAWHRMYQPAPGERVVYMDDLICTGSDARTVLAFLRAEGQQVLGVSAWISRTALSGETLITLAEPPFQTYPAQVNPLSGEPVLYEDVRE